MDKNIFPEMYFFEKDKAQSVYVSKNNFKNFKLHSHEFYEIEFFFEGSGVCEINGREYPFKCGDISFVTPLDIHGYKGNSHVKTLTVHFRLAGLNPSFVDISNIGATLISATDEMKNAFNILINQNPSDEFYTLMCEKITEAILMMLLKKFRLSMKNIMPGEISSAIEYINLNFKNNINLKSISEYAGYSQEHFSRQFKKYTGVGFLSYLTDLRITYAKHLLGSRQVTVTQACYECGFGCIRSFRRAFKKKYGYSPNNVKIKNCP